LRNLDRDPEALNCAERAVALEPTHALTWREVGIATNNLGNHERALEAFRKAAEVGKPTAELWRLQAVALLWMQHNPEALQCAEEALKLKPDDTIALNSTAYILRKMGRLNESLSHLDKALRQQPENSDFWLDKAWTLGEMGQTDQALKAVAEAQRHGCSLRDFHHHRGDLLFLGGRFAEALSELEAGLKVDANDWDLKMDRELALACLGHHGPMMEALPAALLRAQIPASKEDISFEYMLNAALQSLRRGETQIAIGLFSAGMGISGWHELKFFGHLTGNFLRQVLDVRPQVFIQLVDVMAKKVSNENIRQLLDPFLKAAEFIQKKNVGLLERLFPEIRELVLDIVRRVDSELHASVTKRGLQSDNEK